MVSNEEQRSIDDLIERLTESHPEIGRPKITAVVNKTLEEFDSATVRDFVPLFVERRVHVLLGEHDAAGAARFG